ncbi:MAG: polysaccharide deacetylase family protein [Phycisphaerae bacterium]|nr:polysaccharide deacetylase family protein [Phycisphaerae bacterium]
MLLHVIGIVTFLVIPAIVAVGVLRCVVLEYRRDRIPILLYHRLISKAAVERGEVPDDEMIWVCYDTEFAKQMAYLQREGYTTLDFDDYVQIRSGQMPMPPRPVLVTFDDGYLSNYTMGFPILKKFGQKVTVFVAPEPDDHTSRQIEGIDGFVTPEQLREMSENRVSIQSHTLTHRILTELDDDTVRYELEESRRRLTQSTDRPVNHIAIPRAGYSRRIKRLVKEAGYLTACCNNKGSTNGRSEPLALPRIVVERDMSVEDFARLLTPRTSAAIRIVGNTKRIPEHIGGARFARRVRDVLYIKPLRPVFRTSNLKKLMALLGVLYLAAAVWFTWSLISG